jgi:hypothetical protein
MNSSGRDEMRKLLKTFGIQADEAVITHLARSTGTGPFKIRLLLQDLTDYGESPPEEKLEVEIVGEIPR